MLFAKVVVGLPVEGPFDYSVPDSQVPGIAVGCRVRVPWRTSKKVGFVVSLTDKTSIRHVKPIISVIDATPILDAKFLALTKKISDYYCCSWGEAIETALPVALRKGKLLPPSVAQCLAPEKGSGATQNIFIHDESGLRRWEIYRQEIEKAFAHRNQVLVLCPDKDAAQRMLKRLSQIFVDASIVLHKKDSQELMQWAQLSGQGADIVIGTRSAVFAPLTKLGLIIVDQEHDYAYKQDQSPHYHARDVAALRAHDQGITLILASTAPSLESFYMAKDKQFLNPRLSSQVNRPQIKIVDIARQGVSKKAGALLVSRYLQDVIAASLLAREKIMLFLNRHGFATVASCISCQAPMDCPRCSIHLIYHYAHNVLRCHYCNYSIALPKLCPVCNAGYIKFSGSGTEKVESEIARLFPQARIRRTDSAAEFGPGGYDICIATEKFLRQDNAGFDTVAVLSIDNAFNRPDLRASERAFRLLTELVRISRKRIVFQTRLVNHHAFVALQKNDAGLFYTQELKSRRQLRFPPYAHLGYVTIRGRSQERVATAAQGFFERLAAESTKQKRVKVLSLSAGQPAKLRGNYYWQILAKAPTAEALSGFLKKHLKRTSSSGIIVTVDIDPV